MFSRILSQEPLSIVTLTEAKDQLNIIDNDAEDSHIQLLIDAATELASGYTNRMLSSGVVMLEAKGLNSFFLPYGEANDSDDSMSVTVNGEPVEYDFSEISQKLTVSDVVSSTDLVEVTYNAGYPVAPNVAKMGILMLVSSLYNNREDTITGLSVSDIPLDSASILNKIKIKGV